MRKYYVNPNEDDRGLHEVHHEDCSWLHLVDNPVYLGRFDNCAEAVQKAKQDHYQNSDGCAHCSPECHTG